MEENSAKQAPSKVPITEVEPSTPTGVEPSVIPVAPDTNAAPAKPKETTGVTPEEAAKRKRIGIIAGVAAGVVALLCIIIVAVVVATRPSDDTVTIAVTRLLGGETPSNVKIDGEVDIISDDEDSELASVNIKIDSVADNVAAANNTSVAIEAELKNGQKMAFDVDEIKVTDGDTYLRFKNIVNAVEGTATNCADEVGTNCADSALDCATDPTDCIEQESFSMWNLLTSAFEVIDGEWLRISDDDTDMSEVEGLFDDSSLCMVDILGGISHYGNSLTEIYNQNPFVIDASKELGITIAAENNPIYRLGLDTERFNRFSDALDGSTLAKDWTNCMGSSNKVSLEDIFAGEPTVYAEIDENHNFTRVYFDSNFEGELTVRGDLSFSYPTTVTVNEPEDYTNLSEALTNIVMQLFYGGFEL